MDLTTIAGIIIGIACIVAGQVMEGGHVGSLAVSAAAVIVLGGTAGAVLISFPSAELGRALRQIPRLFADDSPPLGPLIPKIVAIARKCRREGLLVLEDEARRAKDPFLKQALLALVDGNDPESLRQILEQAMDQQEQQQEPGVLLFETAGAFAPTIGILGAVIGLIHVMENLADPSSLGSGIAVAFVATVYGVASANLLFLPAASKLKLKLMADRRRKEMILEGLCGIQEGLNPIHIEKRLQLFSEDRHVPA